MKIIILDKIDNSAIDMFKESFETDVKTGLSEQEIIDIINPYDAVVVRSATKITKKIIDAAPNLKLIGRGGTGVDSIDIKAATEKNIAVMNTPTSNCISVTEYVIGLMIGASRNIIFANNKLKENIWAKKESKGYELKDKTLGIIGFGNIGKEVCKRAIAFDMTVLTYDPFIDNEIVKSFGAKKMEIDEIITNSDYITLHIPLIDATKNLIDSKKLESMKKNAIWINCARGGTVDEDALYTALKNNSIKGAALDVFANEPLKNSKLCELNNIILTPHIAGSTHEAQARCGTDLVKQFLYFFNNEYKNILNLKDIKLGD